MQWESVVSDLGVTVEQQLLPYGWWGAYSWERHSIILRPDLGPIQRRSALAHECGHAFFRHRGTEPKQERQASVWAARRLIDESEFIDALRTTDDFVGVAHLLGVMPSDVTTYVSTLSPLEKLLLRELVDRSAPLAQREEKAS